MFNGLFALMIPVLISTCNSTRTLTEKEQTKITQISTPVDTMLAHDRLSTDTFPAFSFIANNKYIILSSDPDTNWTKDIPELPESQPNGTAFISEIVMDSLPERYAALLNKEVRINNTEGESYIATVTGFSYYAIYTPGIPLSGEDELESRDVWRRTSHYLVAEFSADPRGRKNLYFATPANKPAPENYDLTDNVDKQLILSLLPATKDYMEIQKDFEDDKGIGKWWQHDECAEDLRTYAVNGQRFVTLGHSMGSECSSDFGASTLSIWKVSADSKPELIYDRSHEEIVIFAADVDGDGFPEFFIEQGNTHSILKLSGAALPGDDSWTIIDHSCGC